MKDWNDLRVILEVRRAGGLGPAARALGVDHSTLFRRLKAAEVRLGARAFERLPGGAYQATAAGEQLAATAERIETEVLSLDRAMTGRDDRLTGRLRVTSSETLAGSVLTAHLAALRGRHPGLVVELLIDNRVLSLSRREADVALRPVRPREADLWGRRLTDVAWGFYASPAYMERRRDTGPALEGHEVIGWDEGATGVAAARWLADTVDEAAFAYRSNSLVNQGAAAAAGLGIALLPCYLGDLDARLVRARPEPLPEAAGELWIVTHADLKATARIQAVFEVVGSGLASQRALFEGREARASA